MNTDVVNNEPEFIESSNESTNEIQLNASFDDLNNNGNQFKNDFIVEEMLVLARKNKYPKKTITINNKPKSYTPVAHFINLSPNMKHGQRQ